MRKCCFWNHHQNLNTVCYSTADGKVFQTYECSICGHKYKEKRLVFGGDNRKEKVKSLTNDYFIMWNKDFIQNDREYTSVGLVKK